MRKPSLCISIADMTQVGEARRQVASYISELYTEEVITGKIALIVTELATNLVKHARGGRLLVSQFYGVLDIVSIDEGPGFSNVSHSMIDGVSTAGTAGNGLGAVKRLADYFDLYSLPEKGAVIFARVGKLAGEFDVGAVCVAVEGEVECGDSWAWRAGRDSFQLMVVDGLGHGPVAAQAANAAVTVFENDQNSSNTDVLQKIHVGLKITRGAALSILQTNADVSVAIFTGIGNVTGVTTDGTTVRRMISHNGIVGQNMRKVQDFSYPTSGSESVFVLHSDGIATHWEISKYPGLKSKSSSIIAALLFRDHCRGRDDATVAVVQKRPLP